MKHFILSVFLLCASLAGQRLGNLNVVFDPTVSLSVTMWNGQPALVAFWDPANTLMHQESHNWGAPYAYGFMAINPMGGGYSYSPLNPTPIPQIPVGLRIEAAGFLCNTPLCVPQLHAQTEGQLQQGRFGFMHTWKPPGWNYGWTLPPPKSPVKVFAPDPDRYLLRHLPGLGQELSTVFSVHGDISLVCLIMTIELL